MNEQELNNGFPPRLGPADAAAVLENVSDGIIMTDRRLNITYLNPEAACLTGWSLKDGLQKPLDLVYNTAYENEPESRLKSPADAINTNTVIRRRVGLTLTDKSENIKPVADCLAPIRDKDNLVTGLAVIIQSRGQPDKGCRETLSGLPGPDLLKEEVTSLVTEKRKAKREHLLFYLKLDKFTQLAQDWGGEAAAALFKEISVLVRGQIRSDDFMARADDDALALILYSCELKSYERIAAKICHAVSSRRFQWWEHTIRLGANIGIVQLAGNACFEKLMESCQKACLAAAQEGANRWRLATTEE